MTDAAQAAPSSDIDPATLPRWDLADLYPGRDSRELADDLDRAEAEATSIHADYAGRLAGLPGDELGRAIARFEALEEVLGRVMSYAGLVYQCDLADPEIGKFYQSMQERVTRISSNLVFFTLELNRIEDADLEPKFAAPDLAKYRPFLRDLRQFRAHQLSDEVERLLHERYVVGRGAWNRLFEETLADLRFPFRGEDMPLSDVLNLLSDTDRTKRRDAAKSVGDVLGRHSRTFALITNTLAKEKEIDDTWRGYARPVSYRNLSNCVEDHVVDALTSAVKDAYPRLAHRYYVLKAKWFGGDQLDYWDRNAPLPDQDDRRFSWDEARTRVLDAYRAFSPELASVGQRFFDNAWIDAPPMPGKTSGAFAHPTVPSAHPYLLLNYHGRTRDVMTLAHELGHGVHQVLAGRQGLFQSSTPLTLAETASVFGEMLTFQSLLADATEPRVRKAMLAAKVEDMLNTVIRQIAFYFFEERVHARRREGELTPDEIAEIWMAVQTESLGPALRFEDEYRNFWAYIGHFIHTPFYVYAYAFGDCLVNALYAVYQDSDAGFAQRYLDMLSAGGTKRHQELLAPFGLDAADPAFWLKGLKVIEGFVDELEALE